MILIFRNIISLVTALIMLSGGNFAYAVATGDCIRVEKGYITCEMECCKENPCLDDEDKDIPVIKDDSRSCCQLHVEQSIEQDIFLPLLNKTVNLDKFVLPSPVSKLTLTDDNGSLIMIQKFKPPAPCRAFTILRI